MAARKDLSLCHRGMLPVSLWLDASHHPTPVYDPCPRSCWSCFPRLLSLLEGSVLDPTKMGCGLLWFCPPHLSLASKMRCQWPFCLHYLAGGLTGLGQVCWASWITRSKYSLKYIGVKHLVLSHDSYPCPVPFRGGREEERGNGQN